MGRWRENSQIGLMEKSLKQIMSTRGIVNTEESFLEKYAHVSF